MGPLSFKSYFFISSFFLYTQSCVEARLVWVGHHLLTAQRGGTVYSKIHFKDPQGAKIIHEPSSTAHLIAYEASAR